ncbi:hypothetical protein [Leptothoe kymatousa]|uniref:Uncharacterized protein n=1 Tax=Leptothoe kymatousa TAU-MAC 1615 TaxID=2364775 RepID=A0ABS5Y2N2_9CYAN|nr:hypothetical protein [Leptothoe kymatousa]MBT9312082.1 hypothetical protein [Leptothoe kymatousa TAU-MAC 1615]
MSLLSTIADEAKPPIPKQTTPEQKLADAIAEYMQSRNSDQPEEDETQ